jgi:hypothetical protein
MKFVILSTFRKFAEKIQVLLKSDKENWYILCSVTLPSLPHPSTSENHAVYEIMRKTVVDPDRLQMTI